MAIDRLWWERHLPEVAKAFGGRRLTTSWKAGAFGAERMPGAFKHYQNSGAAAVSFALDQGAERVLLLGYDCALLNGEAHWHGDHPAGLGNAGSLPLWPERFAQLAADGCGRVVNCSRHTALRCFPRMDLEDALERDISG